MNLVAKSSNYELYGQMSDRFFGVLRDCAAEVQQYSVDEAFVKLHGTLPELLIWARMVRDRIWKHLGLPVRVGIRRTKTLAKMSNRAAKKLDHLNGVCVWEAVPDAHREQLLSNLPVNEMWGIAGRMAKRLAGRGISTVKDFRDADPVMLRDRFSIVIKEGVRYARAGIVLTDLQKTGLEPTFDLFTDAHKERSIRPLIESIRKKLDQPTIGLDAVGLKAGQTWEMKRGMRSPRCTTHWGELPVVRAV